MNHIKVLYFLFACCFVSNSQAQHKIKVFNFQADNGFQHKSKEAGLEMIEWLGENNEWEVVTSSDTADITMKNLAIFDVIIFNNNCGNKGRIFSDAQQQVLQNYIRSGGGFVGIHCAGAIWNEEGEFQQWYEKLVGARLKDHPKVQPAKLIRVDSMHSITAHLPNEWTITDEWHRFTDNPRERVHVLLSLDENSYEGEQKMGGDHPFTWYQFFDGGRSFFTSLGHTTAIYEDENYQKLIQGGIEWAAASKSVDQIPINEGLLVDLNADQGVRLEDGDRVAEWQNQIIHTGIKSFSKQDEGRAVAGSGRPRLKLKEPNLNGHNSIVFHRQELLNKQEDSFDRLTTGSGYTWFAMMSVYEQVPGKPGVNSFFGNLRNTNVDKKGQYEGFWAGVNQENQPWIGARNALERGLWNENNPHVLSEEPLETSKYHILIGRMGAGIDTVKIELFVNSDTPSAQKLFFVNPNANPSKMSIGQERDATNHPGAESFDGEIARFLIYDRPLSNEELKTVLEYLIKMYK